MSRYKLISMLSPEVPLIIGTHDECLDKQKEYGWSALLTQIQESRHCECGYCLGYITHSSDCAVHNEPAEPNGECNCNVLKAKEKSNENNNS